MSGMVKIRRALISVSDKSNLDQLAKCLKELEVEIISTGGTGKYLTELGIAYTPIENVTGNPESFSGRMKTMSFEISSSLLFRRSSESDLLEAKQLGIEPIDLVVCNLYPFDKVAKSIDATLEKLVENIDIGGPSMIRAAAKNFESVSVAVMPSQYQQIITELTNNSSSISFEIRKELAIRAFRHTAEYDSSIVEKFNDTFNTDEIDLHFSSSDSEVLRYGENPHQKAYIYKRNNGLGIANMKQLQGKELSYNNYLDADTAYKAALDLDKLNLNNFKYVATVVKHCNPCGAAISSSSLSALKKAWKSDPVSSFGSIICFNTEVDKDVANWLKDKFIEVVIAPSFSKSALELFSNKKNLRVCEASFSNTCNDMNIQAISGGILVQESDQFLDTDFSIVTKSSFTDGMLCLKDFGTMTAKYLKSNAILLVKSDSEGIYIAGAGMGNPNRIVSIEQAIEKAKDNGVVDFSEVLLVSDAFFPFDDNVEMANEVGIKHIVQPGGSIKDSVVIDSCNKFNISMAFTGRRHFRH